MFCGNPLPWVDELKHLGNTISNRMDGNQLDIKVKSARYIDKNNYIIQDFYFAHPETKVKLNSIYNGHWTGSQLWRFGCDQLGKLESTFNKSVKIMLDLPWATHCYLIEPLTRLTHVRQILVKRFLSFIAMIRKSSKFALIQLLEIISEDVRLSTGSNLRSIMLLANKSRVEELETSEVIVEYHEIEDLEKWRVDFIREVVEFKLGELKVDGFTAKELEEIQDFLCTQ